MKKNKSKFLTFLLSLIPGVGHYYLGLMKRGLQFMILFGISIGIVSFFASLAYGAGNALVPMLGVALPIIWLYSLFDALHLASKIKSGEEVDDCAIFQLDLFEEQSHRSKFWTFALSIFPGLGHVYLGLFNRGSQIMAVFFIAIVVINMIKVDLLFVLIPLVWFISLFDALERATRLNQGMVVQDDSVINDMHWKPKRGWIGIGLVLLGGYMIFDKVVFDYIPPVIAHFTSIDIVNRYFNSYAIKNQIQTIIVALIIMVIGIRLLKGGKKI